MTFNFKIKQYRGIMKAVLLKKIHKIGNEQREQRGEG